MRTRAQSANAASALTSAKVTARAGRRIAKRVYSNVTGGTVAYTRFVYHGGNVAFETDSGGTIGLRYTWAGTDQLLAVDNGTTHYYAVNDKLGSVRELVRRDGTWIMSQRFGPYGAVIARDTNASASPGFVVRYGWTGREYDSETGLYFFRSRYLDLNVRRFVQEDPAGYGGSSNLYAYVGGDVMEARDPSGMLKRPTWDPGMPIFCFVDCSDPLNPYPSAYQSGGGDDWDGNGVDDGEEFIGDVWFCQTSGGLKGGCLAQLDYARNIGASEMGRSTCSRSSNGTDVCAMHSFDVPAPGDNLMPAVDPPALGSAGHTFFINSEFLIGCPTGPVRFQQQWMRTTVLGEAVYARGTIIAKLAYQSEGGWGWYVAHVHAIQEGPNWSAVLFDGSARGNISCTSGAGTLTGFSP